jgi:Methyltransferase domain
MVGKFSSATTGWAIVLGLALAMAGPSASPAIAESTRPAPPRIDVEFEPTPHTVVDAMLKLAKVEPDDFLIDLGSGDGRIPIAAARSYGATALGIDLDPRLIREARENARRRGVVGKVRFVQDDLFKADISQATVITLFLSRDANRRLRPRLLDLRPGTRIVSHWHDMGSWEPDRIRTYPAVGRTWRSGRLFSWVVPARVDGTWQVRVGGREIDVTLRQRFQRFQGFAIVDGTRRPIRNGRISGTQVSFDLPSGDGRLRRMSGRMTTAGEIRGQGWEARAARHDRSFAPLGPEHACRAPGCERATGDQRTKS